MNVERQPRLNRARYLARKREGVREKAVRAEVTSDPRRERAVRSEREETFIFSRLNAIVRGVNYRARSSHAGPAVLPLGGNFVRARESARCEICFTRLPRYR